MSVSKHKRKQQGIPLDLEYFFDRAIPEPNSGCLIWECADNGLGYGKANDNGKIIIVSRRVFELYNNVTLPKTIHVVSNIKKRKWWGHLP